MVNKKILTSIEPVFERTIPIFQRMFNSVKETIINIITPPPAGNETRPLNEPLLPFNTIKHNDSLELINMN
jgi:hypothetical protein